MSDSTSILDLPTDPIGGTIGNNIKITAQENENISQPQTQQQSGMTLDQTTINQIVNGLQQATLSGATQLPSRDIPMNTNNIMNDPQVMPNYVPQQDQTKFDYINNYEKTNNIIDQQNRITKTQNSVNDLYDELQIPLLIAVLYFLFQLPFLKKMLYKYLPVLFLNDGNYNINGYLFTSILFGIIFHSFNKLTNYFGTF